VTAWETAAAAAKTGKEKFQQKFDFLGKHDIAVKFKNNYTGYVQGDILPKTLLQQHPIGRLL